jgi:hypothetical protein
MAAWRGTSSSIDLMLPAEYDLLWEFCKHKEQVLLCAREEFGNILSVVISRHHCITSQELYNEEHKTATTYFMKCINLVKDGTGKKWFVTYFDKSDLIPHSCFKVNISIEIMYALRFKIKEIYNIHAAC